jgi:hypothetical protein
MRSLPPAYSVVEPIPAPKKLGNAFEKSTGLAQALPTTSEKHAPVIALHRFTGALSGRYEPVCPAVFRFLD